MIKNNRLAEVVLQVVRTVTLVTALLTVAGSVIKYGFPLSVGEREGMSWFFDYVWAVFILDRIFHILLKPQYLRKAFKGMGLAMNILLILTIIPVLAPSSVVSEMAFLKNCLLLLFSILELSYFLTHILGKRTNPWAVLASSFLVIILIGSLLLLMPNCTVPEVNLNWIDSLFTATSAVCVTGLIPVDLASTFTVPGQIIILLLVQIGGLGVMTLTSFFALFFMGEISVNNQMVVKDMLSSNSLSSIWSTLKNIIAFTFSLEAVGFAIIWLSINGTLGLDTKQEIFFSIFHSVSGFCNAGFSNYAQGLANPLILDSNYVIFWTITFLVILGGIGYPVLVEIKNIFLRRIRHVAAISVNTRIVLVFSAVLLVVGTVLTAVFEWNSAFAGRGVFWKITQAFFNSASPRTAGFVSVDLTGFSIQTILLYMFLMWVGGASQSTAGGVKVNNLAVALLNVAAVMRGRSRIEIFNREITHNSVHRANATIVISIVVLAVSILLCSIVSPGLSLSALAFECVSAFSTVGSSLNATPLLSDAGKIVIIFLMFFGRVGMITVISSFARPKGDRGFRLPEAEIM